MSSLGKICLQVIMSLHLDDRTGTAVKGIDMKNPPAWQALERGRERGKLGARETRGARERGAFLSLAPRVSRAPNCLLSLPLSSACHAGKH